jgi:hypothetical protein
MIYVFFIDLIESDSDSKVFILKNWKDFDDFMKDKDNGTFMGDNDHSIHYSVKNILKNYKKNKIRITQIIRAPRGTVQISAYKFDVKDITTDLIIGEPFLRNNSFFTDEILKKIFNNSLKNENMVKFIDRFIDIKISDLIFDSNSNSEINRSFAERSKTEIIDCFKRNLIDDSIIKQFNQKSKKGNVLVFIYQNYQIIYPVIIQLPPKELLELIKPHKTGLNKTNTINILNNFYKLILECSEKNNFNCKQVYDIYLRKNNIDYDFNEFMLFITK